MTIFVLKKEGFNHESRALREQIISFLGIKTLENINIYNRYDVFGIDEKLFERVSKEVLSDPRTDIVLKNLDHIKGGVYFGVEYLPGQYDQRADSARQCIEFLSEENNSDIKVASSKIYFLEGELKQGDIKKIKEYIINPIETREMSDPLNPLVDSAETVLIEPVKTLTGFNALDQEGLQKFIKEQSLALDIDDIMMCQEYFIEMGREPTETEIKVLDTYWSDHCRHTTFNTELSVKFQCEKSHKAFEKYLSLKDKSKPITLMDIATVAMKSDCVNASKVDKSEEVNACTVNIEVDFKDGHKEDWLLLFKNETHNHPTEIEPFGGAATCIGGAIRDPLSGRAYVYAAMRLTGAGNPYSSFENTLKGKLPQRKIMTEAANGYSSYGNQIGVATGLVDELYHEGYTAKRMEIGAVLGAVPKQNVRRETPKEGDIVMLIGGRTGRDGCGGASGSSLSHNDQSINHCAAQVQKGNAPEERKLQRFFRNAEVALMIKKCNDFGAGGVSVAVGELADGVEIYLDNIKKKYDGLTGTELAISESQERMAVVIAKEDKERFTKIASSENLEAVQIAKITDNKKLLMYWKQGNGSKPIVDIDRSFLDKNGAKKKATAVVSKPEQYRHEALAEKGFINRYKKVLTNPNNSLKRGLVEKFDSTIGANTVLMPFGGVYQRTPIQTMVHKISTTRGEADTCSAMSWGYNPYIAEKDTFDGAYLAVVDSVAKLRAAGFGDNEIYLSFQEYYGKPTTPEKWGKPLSALLGAMSAQLDLKIAAIGGKDSMSGTFDNLDVPPTLVSFAVTSGSAKNVISPEFKKAGSYIYHISPYKEDEKLPDAKALNETFCRITQLIKDKKVISAYAVSNGGIADCIAKMCLGNRIGFCFEKDIGEDLLFGYKYGSFVVESVCPLDNALLLGRTTECQSINYNSYSIKLSEVLECYENSLEEIYPTKIKDNQSEAIPIIPAKKLIEKNISVKGNGKPRVIIPCFPGTNCEYDSVKAFEKAGGITDVFVIKNLSHSDRQQAISEFSKRLAKSNILFIPGGFSGGDEPDGSAKFITAFMRNERVNNSIKEMLSKDGLIAGICNGFQALIKLGLLWDGTIISPDEMHPTLTYNKIGRHQSKIVRIKVVNNSSPWLKGDKLGEIYSVPISHGEGRFVANVESIKKLIENGQIATQYVDLKGNPTMEIEYNPNGSFYAIEGITSPDGKIFGKMGHSERVGDNLYKNVQGNYNMNIIKSGVEYFI